EKHGYPKEQVAVLESDDLERIDWRSRVVDIVKIYNEVAQGKPKKRAASTRHSKSSTRKKKKR
ncbi:MAG: hypothetical protein ACRD4B_09200, partial [Acidobacteriota bacterium]